MAESKKTRRPPARDPEARENQLINLAVDLAEKQLNNGTASAQVMTHYLKLATQRERLERAKLEKEVELLRARTDQIAAVQKIDEMYAAALRAMSAYSGNSQEVYDEV